MRILCAGLIALVMVVVAGARSVAAETSPRVAVQPLEGPVGASLRQQIARLVRGHGFQAVTSLPRVEGTSQYPSVARDHRLAAFVTCDLEDHKKRQTLTILVWDGARGDVLARWSASGSVKVVSKALARDFWKRLGPALEKAQTPESNKLEPAPPMRIDAGSPVD